MLAKTSAGPAPAAAECKARKVVELGRNDDGPFRLLSNHPQAIPAELIGSDRCLAVGYVTRGTTPILAMCRRLIEADYDPTTPLHCYRGETLCLLVRSIGEAATLEPNSGGTCFTRRRIRRRTTVRAAPPVAPLATDAPRPHTVDKKHLARRPAPAVRCTQSRRVKVSNGSKQICQRPPLHQAG